MAKTIHMGQGSQKTEFDRMLEAEIRKVAPQQNQAQDQVATAKAKLEKRRQRLFPAQLEFLLSPSKKKAAICTRRAGKTFVCRHLVAEAVLNNPWSDREKAQPVIQYIAQTRGKALDLFWTPFKEICRQIGLDAHWDDHSLRAQFPNGVLVRAGGAEDRDEIEKYRGDAYPLVVIDEAASFGPRIEELVMSALSAALMDYDGTIAMVGTPGQSQVGMFWDIYSGYKPEWYVQKWSYMTNTSFPEEVRTEAWVETNVGPLHSPRVQREYFGNWVPDSSALVYQYEEAKCAWNGTLEKGHDWKYIMGIDVGYRDPTAFVVLATAKTHPHLFVLHAEATSKLLPSQIEKRIMELREQYGTGRIVMDTGGSMAKNNMEEWNRRHNLGILPAQKAPGYKFPLIEHMNSEFYLGRIKVAPGLPLVKEWKTLVWADSDSEKDAARHDGTPKEHTGFANHMADACLYAFKESTHFRSKLPEPMPVPGTPDYLNYQQAQAKINAFRNARRSKSFVYNKLVQ